MGDLTATPAFYQDAPEKRLAVCLFNRATYGRCKELIHELSIYPNFKITLVVGSALLWDDYGKAVDHIEKEHPGVRIQRIETERSDGTHAGMGAQAGALLSQLSRFFSANTFDAVVVVADRYETLPAATAANYHNLPVVHLQGGEVTGNIDDRVRNAVTKLADLHFVATDLCKEYVLAMGEERERVFKTGCPSIDVLKRNRVTRYTPKEKYILSIFHPETENSEKAFEQTRIVMEAVLEYCAEHQFRCHWFYPNPDPGREEIVRYLDLAVKENPALVMKAINKPPVEFLKQLAGARLIVGNSSCGIRESAWLGLPAVNVGERQKMRERAYNVVSTDYDRAEILAALKYQHTMQKYPRSQLFGDGRASRWIAQYLQRIQFSLKGPLTYPLQPRFKEQHFGPDRTRSHTQRRNPPGTRAAGSHDHEHQPQAG